MTRFHLMLAPVLVAGTLAACSGPAPTGSDANTTVTSAGATEPAVENATTPLDNVSEPAPAANEIVPAPAATAKLAADYLGRWRGVEGMFLNVTKGQGDGVMLEMQWDLDHKGSFPATVTPEGLRFTRNGTEEVARPSDGDATGLKWLAGKQDCLTVKSGEGYCRV